MVASILISIWKDKAKLFINLKDVYSKVPIHPEWWAKDSNIIIHGGVNNSTGIHKNLHSGLYLAMHLKDSISEILEQPTCPCQLSPTSDPTL